MTNVDEDLDVEKIIDKDISELRTDLLYALQCIKTGMQFPDDTSNQKRTIKLINKYSK